MNSANTSNFYYYRFYGFFLRINQQLVGFAPLQNIKQFEIKVSLLANSSAQGQKLLELYDFDWTPLSENTSESNFDLSKASQNQKTYYKIRYVVQQELIEYIFDADGNEIWGFYSTENILQDTVSLLLGYVLGNVARLRGYLAFHASAIAVKNRVILLTGDSGAGKSTTAAALSRIGCPILADDIAVLKLKQGQYWVEPGYPGLRLWPKSFKVFDTCSKELTRVSSFRNKRYLNLESSNSGKWLFQSEALPLAGIYIMGQRSQQLEQSSVQSLASSQAMTKLIKSVYGSYFLNQNIRKQEFQQLAQFVRQVPVRQLSRPNNLGNLAQLCSLIIKDAQLLTLKI